MALCLVAPSPCVSRVVLLFWILVLARCTPGRLGQTCCFNRAWVPSSVRDVIRYCPILDRKNFTFYVHHSYICSRQWERKGTGASPTCMWVVSVLRGICAIYSTLFQLFLQHSQRTVPAGGACTGGRSGHSDRYYLTLCFYSLSLQGMGTGQRPRAERPTQ